MSSAISQLNCDSFIRDKVGSRWTHAAIASQLQQIYPGVSSGLSARSVKRYCSINDIHYSSGLNEEQLDEVVEHAVFRVKLYGIAVLMADYTLVFNFTGWVIIWSPHINWPP